MQSARTWLGETMKPISPRFESSPVRHIGVTGNNPGVGGPPSTLAPRCRVIALGFSETYPTTRITRELGESRSLFENRVHSLVLLESSSTYTRKQTRVLYPCPVCPPFLLVQFSSVYARETTRAAPRNDDGTEGKKWWALWSLKKNIQNLLSDHFLCWVLLREHVGYHSRLTWALVFVLFFLLFLRFVTRDKSKLGFHDWCVSLRKTWIGFVQVIESFG